MQPRDDYAVPRKVVRTVFGLTVAIMFGLYGREGVALGLWTGPVLIGLSILLALASILGLVASFMDRQ